MNKTVVINVVALSNRLIGEHTPFLAQWTQASERAVVRPPLPAVTTTSQYTYLTGRTATEHGIVGNGWYFRDECEIKFWRQSNKLVQAPKIWEVAKEMDPSFTCANLFWWYNMYSEADYSVTPRPLYPADGRKLPDCYADPLSLRHELQAELGQFPLFEFWGPRTTINSSKWIAEAAKRVDQRFNPTLSLIYLPHLDYGLQKFGHDFSKIGKDLREIDDLLRDLVGHFEQKGASVVLLSEYGITPVSRPVHLNRVLREKGYIAIKDEQGLEALDAGVSRAFAVADHQIAHIYVQNAADIPTVKALIEQTPGVEQVLDEEGKRKFGLAHERAGELVAIAQKDAWFTYYYWLDDRKAPDFARTVDIHRKPGYDPVEMFADPNIPSLPLKVGWILLKKKMGFRTLMDITPLDASLVKGSHGRLPEDTADWPVFFSKQPNLGLPPQIQATEVFDWLLRHLQA